MFHKITIQEWFAIASFSTGTVLAFLCLFAVQPYGEISHSALSIVSEFLVLCGALLGIKSHFDSKLEQFSAEIKKKDNADNNQ